MDFTRLEVKGKEEKEIMPTKTRSFIHGKTEEIVELYHQGLSVNLISQKVGITNPTVKKILIGEGIKVTSRSKRNLYTKIVLEKFSKEKTVKELAAECNLTEKLVARVLKENNVDYYGRGFSSMKVKHNPFEILTPEAYYWIGYIIADGNLVSSGKYTISIVSKDLDHLKKFIKFINIPLAIHPTVNDCYSVQFGNKAAFDQLVSYGITPRKSLTLKLSIELNWSLIRGIFDGDGSFTDRSGFKIISGSRKFIEQVSDFFTREGIKSRVVPEGNYYKLYIYHKDRFKLIYQRMYDGGSFLERKEIQIRRCIG